MFGNRMTNFSLDCFSAFTAPQRCLYRLHTAASYVVAVTLAFGLCWSGSQVRADAHLELGNPSKAAQTSENNYLVSRPEYVLSYNRSRGGPNWVSWHLGKKDLGEIKRSHIQFAGDQLLPALWRIRHDDYTNSGYDRGHLCPSADRTRTVAANKATFMTSNILPQTADLNQGVWARLEEYCRQLVRGGKELDIISGGARSQGRIANKITVPTSFWKIILVLPEGNNDLQRITKETRVIAVFMPNTRGVRSDPWQRYVTNVDSLESETGYDFLSHVDPTVQEHIERSYGH